MSAGLLERVIPGLDDSPPIDMPPIDIIKCQCSDSCPLSGACENEATGDDLMCDPCRKAMEDLKKFKERLFTASMGPFARIMASRPLPHCHKCDPEFDKVGDDDAPSSS